MTMTLPSRTKKGLREKFHDVNNALQGLSNLIVTLRRDETYTPEIGDLLSATFTRVKETVEAARNVAVEGGEETPHNSRATLPVRFPVLLIDPDPLSRRMSATRLKALGYEALSADGEAAAIDALRANRGIRAALVDYVDTESVARLCKKLLKTAPDLGIILSLHESLKSPDVKSLGFRPVGILVKPIKAHRVAELIGKIGREQLPASDNAEQGVSS